MGIWFHISQFIANENNVKWPKALILFNRWFLPWLVLWLTIYFILLVPETQHSTFFNCTVGEPSFVETINGHDDNTFIDIIFFVSKDCSKVRGVSLGVMVTWRKHSNYPSSPIIRHFRSINQSINQHPDISVAAPWNHWFHYCYVVGFSSTTLLLASNIWI